jgi:hypothetical protein
MFIFLNQEVGQSDTSRAEHPPPVHQQGELRDTRLRNKAPSPGASQVICFEQLEDLRNPLGQIFGDNEPV